MPTWLLEADDQCKLTASVMFAQTSPGSYRSRLIDQPAQDVMVA
jgi:hypothetical protein